MMLTKCKYDVSLWPNVDFMHLKDAFDPAKLGITLYTEGDRPAIDSDSEDMVFLDNRNIATIGNIRNKFGRRAFLVGVIRTDADSANVDKVESLLKSARMNLCIMHGDNKDDVFVLTPEGGRIPLIDGEVRLENGTLIPLLDFLQQRKDVSWYKTAVSVADVEMSDSDIAGIRDLIDLAHETGLLVDHNGNISYRLTDPAGGVAMSPRAVDKASVAVKDMLRVSVDQNSRAITAVAPRGGTTSSIDSGVSAYLYEQFTGLKAIVHTHCDWGVGFKQTDFPYPCGVKEEAIEMEKILLAAGYDGLSSFLLRLVEHGFVLGMHENLTTEQIRRQWHEVNEDFDSHVTEIGTSPAELRARGKIQPILSPDGIVGYVFEDNDGAVAPRLMESSRGRGWGRDLIEVLKMKNSIIKTVNDCNVEQFYIDHGFEVVDKDEGVILLKPKLS